MSPFERAKLQPADNFLRDVGVHLAIFLLILEKVSVYIEAERERRPIKRRGLKSSISLADQLLLTFRYLRHYPAFARLGEEFGISESYANKIYHRILNILLKVLKMNSRKELMNCDLNTILIDVTEQPIERPKRRQRDYFSGKKSDIPSAFS
jgi:hypothetical protein